MLSSCTNSADKRNRLSKALKGRENRCRYNRAGPLGVLFDNVKRLEGAGQALSPVKIPELHALCTEFVTELLACTGSSIYAHGEVLAEIVGFFGLDMLQNR
jgi:hypothetical protein